jgi:hypothetical protein
MSDGVVWFAIIDIDPWARELQTMPSALKKVIPGRPTPTRLRHRVRDWLRNNVPPEHLAIKSLRKAGLAGDLGHRNYILTIHQDSFDVARSYIKFCAAGGDYRFKWAALPDGPSLSEAA